MHDSQLWEVMIPKRDNAGNDFSKEHHLAWDAYVTSLAGGITILRTAKGQWISPDGSFFSEDMIPVRIFCSEVVIDKIIDYTLEHYGQEAIFAYQVSSKVKIRQRKGDL